MATMPPSTAELCWRLILANEDFLNLGDQDGLRGSVNPGNVYVGLMTADPGTASSQQTNEANFPGYARKAYNRATGSWTFASDQVSNAGKVTMATATAGASQDVTFWYVGTSPVGAGRILFKGPIRNAGGTPVTRHISEGVQPEFEIGDLVLTLG